MEDKSSKKSMQFTGEVVETFDEKGKRAAKIRVDPHIIEIVLQEHEEARLSDKVIIEATVSVTSVKLFVPSTRGEPV